MMFYIFNIIMAVLPAYLIATKPWDHIAGIAGFFTIFLCGMAVGYRMSENSENDV